MFYSFFNRALKVPYDVQATRVSTLRRAVQLHLELLLYRACITEFAAFALSVW
ncbi:hypothetical protein PC116_g10284 [Phytophthora cactorum]|nr:hypothetical protein Pcac1_g6428 [Phytophthora cactorum]KAG4241768.1 hypothetical protein PC116_g10284 [Phytophthora cactorum]